MKLPRIPPPASPLLGYAAAFAAVGVALSARLALTPLVGVGTPLVELAACVAFCAWYAGPGPALLAAAVGAAALAASSLQGGGPGAGTLQGVALLVAAGPLAVAMFGQRGVGRNPALERGPADADATLLEQVPVQPDTPASPPDSSSTVTPAARTRPALDVNAAAGASFAT